jgi:aspartyl-tRNA(Asn)/glutamyl-tRNA(Gln) amidotransferase subunit C
MKEEISVELFDHLVDLAALALSVEEAEYLRRELNNQLAAIHTLESIPLPEGLEPAARGVPYPPERSQPLREDRIEECEQVEAILAQAPEVEDGYIIVPDIPHEDL